MLDVRDRAEKAAQAVERLPKKVVYLLKLRLKFEQILGIANVTK
jgi:hypothetical protein